MSPPERFDPYDVLRRCGLFAGIDERWQRALAAEAVIVRHDRGAMIFRDGERCPGIYVVAMGQVRLFKQGPSGKEMVLHLADPGRTFAEVAAFGDFPTPACAQATQDTVCALVPAERLRALLHAHHELALQFLAGMAQWVRQLVALLEDVVLRDATARVARRLLELSGGADSFRLTVRKRDLALQLNLTSETFSRTLRRLADSEVLRTDGDEVSVLDRVALAALGEAS